MEKEELLKEIAGLIGDSGLSLNSMEFMSEEELLSIKNMLLKRKSGRAEEQKSWCDEIAQKCSKDEV